MVYRKLIGLLLLSAGLFLSGCEETVTNDEGGNNVPNPVINFNNAVTVNFGIPVQGYIRNKGDYNVYKITSRRGGVLEIKADTVPGNLNLTLDMYDSQKNWLFGNYGSFGQTVYLNAVRPPNTYYVVIKDGDGDATSEQPFSFLVNMDSTDVYEFNNTLGTARTIGLDNEIQAKIKPESDEDVFQFYSPKDGILKFTIGDVPANIDMISDIYDYQNNYKGGVTGTPGESYSFGSMQFAGTYYIKLKDGYMDAFSNNYYKLKITLDTTDFWEINNTFNYAKWIGLNQTVSAKINPIGDVDLYKVQITSTGALQVAVTQVPADITMVVELYDSLQVKVANAIGLSNGQPVTLNYVVPVPRMYYVKLTDEYDDNLSDEYYYFNVVK